MPRPTPDRVATNPLSDSTVLHLMEPLPLKFEKSQWLHTQLARRGQYALYERKKETSPRPHYEVILIGVFQEAELHGRKIEAHEFYPGSTAFGKSAWSFHDLAEATQRFNVLTGVRSKGRAVKPKHSVN